MENIERTLSYLLKIIDFLNLKSNLSLKEMLVFSILNKDYISIKEIKTRSGLDAYRVSRIIRGLERHPKGPLIRREIDHFDRRSVLISLTTEGVKMKKELLSIFTDFEDKDFQEQMSMILESVK